VRRFARYLVADAVESPAAERPAAKRR
jgi:hypothetical protein